MKSYGKHVGRSVGIEDAWDRSCIGQKGDPVVERLRKAVRRTEG